jgi:peptidoglycan/xylan/chitin deacetylase (PgdA/CDA1 family)
VHVHACSGGRQIALCATLALLLGPVGCLGGEPASEDASTSLRGPPPPEPFFASDADGARHRCTIVGTPANDVLVGTPGPDVICALAGNDTVTGGSGDDVLDGGSGLDTVSFAAARKGVRARLGSRAVGEGSDRLNGFERVHGSSHADLLDARDGRPFELLDGGGGRDVCLVDPGDSRTRCRHPLARSHARSVPVLMYHLIADPPPGTPNIGLWVSPKSFRQQLRYLERNGYSVVSLQAVYDYWHGGPLARKPVVLSFDDGFESDYSRVMPMLAAHRWAGVLNLSLNHYERRGWGLKRWMVRRMILRGWEVDCHTATHAALPGLAQPLLVKEVVRPRLFLRRTFHVPVNFFAYPSGLYDRRVVRFVRTTGFLGAVTTQPRFAAPSEPYALGRMQILRSDSLHDFVEKLRGG